MLSFYKLYEAVNNEYKKATVPFNVGGKEYILRFFGRPATKMFPNNDFLPGYMYEIDFSRAGISQEKAYSRTGDNSFSEVRALLNILPNLIVRWVLENKPTGYFWTGVDKKLDLVWKKLTSKVIAPGYVRLNSFGKWNFIIQTHLQSLLDKTVYE